ncbi:Copia protein, partial [Mucuna pruriens]
MYHVPPKVFGCVCFVHDVSLGCDKLFARAIKCVFLGYSRLQKGHYQFHILVQQSCHPLKHIIKTYSNLPLLFILKLNYLHLQCLHVKARHKRWVPQYVKIHLIHFLYPQPTPHRILFHPHLPMILTLVGLLLFKKVFTLLVILILFTLVIIVYLLHIFLLFPLSRPLLFLNREGLDHPRWQQVMIVEMQALEQSGTWELVSLPLGKKVVGCRWVFVIKVAPNNTVDCLKARLVAKGYTQVYGLDYGDTFSPVAKITTIRLLLAMAAIRHWPLHQLDIKNAFLHGDLDEEIYMEAWFGKFSQVVQNFGMTRSEVDHSVCYCHSSSNLDHVKYFLGIEFAQSKEGIVISQRKHALDILQETSMSNCKLVGSPMDPNMKLMVKQGEPYSDPERYRRLTDISFAVGVVSQFMQAPSVDHWAAVLHILRYIKKTPGQGLLYEDKGDTHISGYCDADWIGSPIDR